MPTSPDEPDPPVPGFVVDRVSAGYGAAVVVNDVSMTIGSGEIAAVIGPNGSGKSTLLKAVTGGLPARGGRVLLNGADVPGMPRHLLARRGLAYVPQQDDVFRSLTVRENLELGGYQLTRARAAKAAERVLDRFPGL